MLHITYEATTRLDPGRLARISEDRGTLQVELDKGQPLAEVVRQLNIEMCDFLARADWFQLWGNEIHSRHAPKQTLSLDFILLPGAPHGVGILEDRGAVRIYVGAGMTTEEFAASMNPAVQDFLGNGHWFQLFAGEIIDHSPEPMSKV